MNSAPLEAPSSPEAHEHRAGFAPVLIGVALSVPFAVLLRELRDPTLDLLALILAASGGIYWGVAASEGRRGLKAVEAAAGVAFIAMAMLGLTWTSLWIAAGFALHGVWDVLHHPRRIRTGLRAWFPPFCATFDWLVAIYIVLLR